MFDELTADFDSHRIQGLAYAALRAGTDPHFDVPLISEIEHNLWMGGVRDFVRLPDDFRFVISLYHDEKYRVGKDTSRYFFAMEDIEELPDPRVIRDIAETVNRCRTRGKTLVHCQAGLNRSGLITAYALVLSGYKPELAIDLLRAKRSPVVLCNQTFTSWLLEQEHLS